MAGFFGLFDYSKPGPGVEKNGPQKKSFVIFFEIYFRKFWKLCTANLLFVLVSLPVLSYGLASAGLTYITRNYAREKHAFVSGDFFDTIKKNWKQALPVGIINTFVNFIMAFNLWYVYGAISAGGGTFYYILAAVYLSIWLIFSFMKYYIYMMLITFKLNFKQLYKNSLIFAFAGMVRNFMIFILMGLIYAIPVFLFFLLPEIGIVVGIFSFIFLIPAFRSLLIQYATFPLIKKHMIDPYYEAHPDEDKAAKQALNISDNDELDEEERVFVDTVTTDEEPAAPKNTFPRQYNEQDMKKIRRSHQRSRRDDSDDDGTI